jgi:hypothetical protein
MESIGEEISLLGKFAEHLQGTWMARLELPAAVR